MAITRNPSPPSAPPSPPGDQAAGLRRLFAGRRRHFIPLVANPHVAFASVVLERLTTALAQSGIPVLLVDAADTSPAPRDVALLDLGACVEPLDAHTHYLAARGLPRDYVDTRGAATGFLTALANAAPQAQVIVVHGEASDLSRVFQRVDARPVLIAGDRVESVKHAYAAMKLFAQRAQLMTFDLLMCAPAGSRRARAVATSMGSCADQYVGAMLSDWALIDPACDVTERPGEDLLHLLARQLHLTPASTALPPGMTSAFGPAASRTVAPAWQATSH
ncbi:MAG: flagellar biosynthesis protein [Rubrivivax sp.]|jgi:hypothetical protein